MARLLTLLLLLVVPLRAYQAPPAGNENKGQNQTHDSAKPTHDAIDYVNASSTAVIAVFTFLLFIGVMHQIRTSKAIERAWVMVEIQIDPEKPSDGKLQVFEGSGSSGDSTAVMKCSFELQ